VAIEKRWFGLEAPESLDHADVAIFGVPFDQAVSFRRGAAEGPERIRMLSSYLPPTTEDGAMLDNVSILDLGDMTVDITPGESDSLYERVYHRWTVARERGLPLVLGGDHSISIPLLRAASKHAGKPYGLVWIDAHPDLCDWFGGSRHSHACVLRRATEGPNLKSENIILVGTRSFEIEEIEYIRSHGVRLLTSRHLATRDPKDVATEILERFQGMPVYLSLNIDAFDPSCAPGTGMPDAGGLSARWVLDLLRDLAPLDLIGMDIVEVAPPLDVPSDPTSLLALKVILQVLERFAKK
jgi:agmatinase